MVLFHRLPTRCAPSGLAVGERAAGALSYILPLIAGNFLYIAAADIIPVLMVGAAFARAHTVVLSSFATLEAV